MLRQDSKDMRSYFAPHSERLAQEKTRKMGRRGKNGTRSRGHDPGGRVTTRATKLQCDDGHRPMDIAHDTCWGDRETGGKGNVQRIQSLCRLLCNSLPAKLTPSGCLVWGLEWKDGGVSS